MYSRFIIAPRRSGKTNYPGAVNLASGSLGAFGGFFHKEFRHHDYELGRRNAQKFFRDEFMLPNDNIIMKYGYKSITTDLYSGQSGREDRTEHKQIIPIMGESVTNEILQPVWPSDVFDNIQLNEKTQMVFKRLDRVIRIIVDREISGFWMRIIAKTALWWFKKSLKSKVYSSLKDMQSLIKNS